MHAFLSSVCTTILRALRIRYAYFIGLNDQDYTPSSSARRQLTHLLSAWHSIKVGDAREFFNLASVHYISNSIRSSSPLLLTMKILIIGAGLGGLSAALRFAGLGHQVLVYEQRASLSPRGGALSTRPAASKILHAWGLAADLERIANKANGIVIRNLKTGDVVAKSASSQDTEYPHWGTTREELIELFYSKAIEAGALVKFKCTVSDVRDDADQASITFEDGTIVSGHLILAADGIHSPTRHCMLAGLADPFDPIVSRITAYGFKLDALQVKKYSDASSLMENQCSNVWTGDGSVFAVTRYSPKGQYVAILCHSTDATDQKALWDERGDIGYVRGAFAASCPSISRALRLAESCDRWKFAQLPFLPRWTSKKGRIVLLGDSSHAMHPSAGQGFSQIVEDIEVLFQLICQATDPERSTARLTEAWQDIRKPRVERIQGYSVWNTRKVSKEVQSLPEQRAGEAIDFEDPEFVKWTLEYDVQNEVSVFCLCATQGQPCTDN